MSLLKSTLQKGGGSLPPLSLPPRGPGPRGRRQMSFEPIDWNKYFSESDKVEWDECSFRTYRCGSHEASLLVVLLHGGGYCGLSWAIFASELTKRVSVDCLAIDLRGHGDTTSPNDEDLSEATMCEDIGRIVNMVKDKKSNNGTKVSSVVLVGHSMGGALAVRVAAKQLIEDISGVVVIDVVEGTAVEALSGMQTVLKSRPKTFPSVEAAIQWACKTGQTRNLEAARVSMPGQVIKSEGVICCESESEPVSHQVTSQKLGEISEEGEEEEVHKPYVSLFDALFSVH